MNRETLIFIAVVFILSAASVWKKKLTVPAAFTGALIACCIYAGVGIAGVCLLAAFFVLGVGATSFNSKQKQQFNTRENSNGRTSGQVFANGGVAAMVALIAIAFPAYSNVILVMIAGAFSSAAADTVSSELGVVYGRRFYNILSFSTDTKGENGVISLEGTLFGVAASLIIASMYVLFNTFSVELMLIIVFAGTAGNLSDSLLGATLERRQILGNNAVNFINTLIGALAAWMFLNLD